MGLASGKLGARRRHGCGSEPQGGLAGRERLKANAQDYSQGAWDGSGYPARRAVLRRSHAVGSFIMSLHDGNVKPVGLGARQLSALRCAILDGTRADARRCADRHAGVCWLRQQGRTHLVSARDMHNTLETRSLGRRAVEAAGGRGHASRTPGIPPQGSGHGVKGQGPECPAAVDVPGGRLSCAA